MTNHLNDTSQKNSTLNYFLMTSQNKPTKLCNQPEFRHNSSESPTSDGYADFELALIMSKILNVSEDIIFQNISLFKNINPVILNSLFYLSEMNGSQKIISALHSLEFVHNFNVKINDYIKQTD